MELIEPELTLKDLEQALQCYKSKQEIHQKALRELDVAKVKEVEANKEFSKAREVLIDWAVQLKRTSIVQGDKVYRIVKDSWGTNSYSVYVEEATVL